MTTKRFRMFCGPNGSGKSTLINEIEKQYNLGYFINADLIKSKCDRQHYLKGSDYCSRPILQKQWTSFLEDHGQNRQNVNLTSKIQVKDNILVCNESINSYEAALIATFFRYKLLKEKRTFSF